MPEGSFCYQCGYDLTGLDLPHPCPECGRPADSARDISVARKWFASRHASYEWLIRPSRVPLAIWCALDDEGSTRIARNRSYRWLWLPTFYTFLCVALGFHITIDYDVSQKYYQIGDPEKRVLRDHRSSETDRIYTFNLHFRDMFFPTPARWTSEVERVRKRFTFQAPPLAEYLNPMPMIFVALPLIGILCGIYPARALAVRFSPSGSKNFAVARRNAASLAFPAFGMLLWSWFATMLTVGFVQLLNVEEEALFVGYLLVVIVIAWLILSAVSWFLLVRLDRAGRVFPGRWRWGLAFAAVAVVTPALAVRCMVWLLR